MNDGEDGFDTIEWVGEQDWCTGRVGMVGISYEGLTQWWAAAARPPSLACISPMAVGAARIGHGFSCGSGIPTQYWLWWSHLVSGRTMQHPRSPSWAEYWEHLPLRNLHEELGTSRGWWPKYAAERADYPDEDAVLSAQDWDRFSIPALIGMGWWDDQTTVANWRAIQRSPAADASRLLIGAWDHGGNESPRRELGGFDMSESLLDPVETTERFLRCHLKDERPVSDSPNRCRIFRTGAMDWEELSDWPRASAEPMDWYLGADGRLAPDSSFHTGSSSYVYDPRQPPEEIANLSDYARNDPPLDVRYVMRRDDTLAFKSETLDVRLDVSGRAVLEAFITIDVPDTDVGALLCDVYPDGRWMVLSGMFAPPPLRRLSVQDGFDTASAREGKPQPVIVPMAWLHHSFLPDHRVGLVVMSSLRPVYAQNLNLGIRWADADEARPATVNVHHHSTYPSRVLLPVEPRSQNALR